VVTEPPVLSTPHLPFLFQIIVMVPKIQSLLIGRQRDSEKRKSAVNNEVSESCLTPQETLLASGYSVKSPVLSK
jgi:hypothetical protein